MENLGGGIMTARHRIDFLGLSEEESFQVTHSYCEGIKISASLCIPS